MDSIAFRDKPLLTFEPSSHFGEYIEGSHWKDKPLIQKVLDVAIAIFKTLVISAIVGAIVASIFPPITLPLGIALAGLVLTIGIAAISYSIYKAHAIDGAQRPEIPSMPHESAWNRNDILMTENGPESMEMKLRLIRSAEHSIEISGSYCGGAIFDRFLEEIDHKMASNPSLTVRIISNADLLTFQNRKKIKQLQKKYSNFFLVETKKEFICLPTWRSIENHTKLLIVDGSHCITGGTGIQDMLSREGDDESITPTFKEKIMGRGARDMDAVVSGPIAEKMRREFYHLLSKWQSRTPQSRHFGNFILERDFVETIPPIIREKARENGAMIYKGKEARVVKGALTTFITGSYEHGNKNGCVQAYLKMIQTAQSTITIANMSFNQPEILNELEKAAQRGVKIRIITNARHENSSAAVFFLGPVNQSNLERFLSLGAECFIYSQPSTLYHKKVMIIDDRLTTIGSFNLSYHCADTEDEDILVIDSEEVAHNTHTILEEDISRSHALLPSNPIKSFFRSIWVKLSLGITKYLFQ